MVDDECNDVRLAVAKQRFGLYQLANDSCPEVRKAVAKHGFSLHKLSNDSNWKYVKLLCKLKSNLTNLIYKRKSL